MFQGRFLYRAVIVAGTLAFALPAIAGTLGPRLQALADTYHKAPRTTLAQAVKATRVPARNLFSPHVNAAGKVQVYIHYRPGEIPSPAVLASLGASNVIVSRPLGIVQAWIPIAKLRSTAALTSVKHLTLPIYGMAEGSSAVSSVHDTCSPVPGDLDVDNEAIAAENVGVVHKLGVTGAGVKVGITSSGVECISDSQAAGYLPNNVWIDPALPGVSDGAQGGGDEGTAMLEEVHAIASNSDLGFCSGLTTVDFLQCLNDFAAWGANVISKEALNYDSLSR